MVGTAPRQDDEGHQHASLVSIRSGSRAHRRSNLYIGESHIVTVASLVIRDELPADIDAIENVIERAFAKHPHSQQTEHRIVRELRAAGALVLPKVAVLAGAIVGYATFSLVRLTPEHGGWYGLGPVAVGPEFHGLRIGSALMTKGLEALKGMGTAGCVVLGEPRFYRRFGFEREPRLTLDGVPPEYFLAHVFKGPAPSATVSYHPAFSVAG
jgi:putative acetyltransferase